MCTAGALLCSLGLLSWGAVAAADNLLTEMVQRQDSATPSIEEALREYIDTRTERLHINAYFDNRRLHINRFADAVSVFLQQRITNFTCVVNSQRADLIYPFKQNLYYTDSLAAFVKMLPRKRLEFGSNKKFYVIMLQRDMNASGEYRSLVRAILQKLYEREVLDVLVIVEDTPGLHLVYTDEIFGRNSCRSINLMVVNSFQGGRFAHPALFTDKLKDLNRCPLHVVSRLRPPYIMDGSPSGDPVTGIEGEMLKALAAKFNFELVLHKQPAVSEVYANGTTSGGFQQLALKQADILMGGYVYTYERAELFSPSVSYLVDPLVVVRRRPPKLQPKSVFLTLTLYEYLACLCVGLGVCAVRLIAPRYRRWHCDGRDGSVVVRAVAAPVRECNWLHVVGSALGMAQLPFNNFSYALRCALLLWCIGFMIYATTYQGRLFVVYNQQPREERLTLDGIIAARYTFLMRQTLGDNSFYRLVLKVPDENIVRLPLNDSYQLYDFLLNATGKRALLVSRRHLLYFVRTYNLYEALDIIPGWLKLQSLCAYFQPNSYLVELFNNAINAMRSGGLLLKWRRQTESKFKARARFDALQPLSLQDLATVLVGFAASQMLAIVVFLLELAWARYKRTRAARAREREALW